MSDRLSEIEGRLAHEDERCCDHRNTEWGNCTDCMNTGHAHAPYIDGEAKRDLATLVKFARAVREELAMPNPTTAVIAQALDALEAS